MHDKLAWLLLLNILLYLQLWRYIPGASTQLGRLFSNYFNSLLTILILLYVFIWNFLFESYFGIIYLRQKYNKKCCYTSLDMIDVSICIIVQKPVQFAQPGLKSTEFYLHTKYERKETIERLNFSNPILSKKVRIIYFVK